MLVIAKAPSHAVNAQLIKRKIRAENVRQDNPNEIHLKIDEKYRPKVVQWFSESEDCLWFSAEEKR